MAIALTFEGLPSERSIRLRLSSLGSHTEQMHSLGLINLDEDSYDRGLGLTDHQPVTATSMPPTVSRYERFVTS